MAVAAELKALREVKRHCERLKVEDDLFKKAIAFTSAGKGDVFAFIAHHQEACPVRKLSAPRLSFLQQRPPSHARSMMPRWWSASAPSPRTWVLLRWYSR